MQRYAEMTDPALAKALAHPLRSRILARLEEKTASPSELAEELDISLGVVSYHVRRLHALGFLKLVRRVPRRGAMEHYYTTVAGPRISSQAWESTPGVVKQAVLGATLAEIGGQASAAVQAGGFESPRAHLSRSPITVDRKGWDQLSRELDRLVSRIERIASESRERLRDEPDHEARRATVALMLFQTPEPKPGPKRRSKTPGRRQPAERE